MLVGAVIEGASRFVMLRSSAFSWFERLAPVTRVGLAAPVVLGFALVAGSVGSIGCGSNTGTTTSPVGADADDPNAAGDRDFDDDDDVVDLDAKDRVWIAARDGQALVLFTFKDQPRLILDVRESPRAPTRAQYVGARPSRERSFALVLACLNPGSASACPLGDEKRLACAIIPSARSEGEDHERKSAHGSKRKRARLDCGPDALFEEARPSDVER